MTKPECRNIGILPVCPAEMFSAASRLAGCKPAGRTDYKSMFRHSSFVIRHSFHESVA